MDEINDLKVIDDNNIARFPEGQTAASLNNAARALEGLIARWSKDTNASVTASGTGDLIAVSANQMLTAYYDGLVIAFAGAATCTGGGVTLNVDGLGAKSLLKFGSAALSASDIVSGRKVIAIYDGTTFQVISPMSDTVSSDAAAASATAAAASVTSAATSATNSATSATNSATAEANAAASAANAAASTISASASDTSAQASAATALAATVGKYDTKIAISSVDSPYTVASMTVDTLLNVNTTGGSVIVNLPAASGETDNRLLGINKIGAVNTVTINSNGTDTIGGAASFTQYDDTEWADLYLDKARADWLLGNLSYTNAGPGLKKLGSTISIDPTTTPQIATDQSWTGSQRATFVAANTGAYDMNAGQNFTTVTTGPTVLSFTNITNGQSGLIDFNNTLAGPVTVAGAYITGSGTLLTTISAAGVYTLGYYSPDGVNVRITNSGLQGVPA